VASSDPPTLPPPERPVQLEAIFLEIMVNGQRMFCAEWIDYKMIEISYEGFIDRCLLCPGWGNGEPNNS